MRFQNASSTVSLDLQLRHLSFRSSAIPFCYVIKRAWTILEAEDGWSMIHDAFEGFPHVMNNNLSESDDMEPNLKENTSHLTRNQFSLQVEKLKQLMKYEDEELYPGCKKFSKLSFLLHLYHLKWLCKWTDESFDVLLGLLKDALPDGEKLPPSYYETKKIVEGVGLKDEKIHACLDDCVLFKKELADKDVNECLVCDFARRNSNEKEKFEEILRLFPLYPR